MHRGLVSLLLLLLLLGPTYGALEQDADVWWPGNATVWPYASRCSWFARRGGGTAQCTQFLGHALAATGWEEEPHLRGNDPRQPTFTVFDVNRYCFGAPVHTGALGEGYAVQSATRSMFEGLAYVRPRESPAAQVIDYDTGRWTSEGSLPVTSALLRYADRARRNRTHRVPFQRYAGHRLDQRNPALFDLAQQPIIDLHAEGGQRVTLQSVSDALRNTLRGPPFHIFMGLGRTAWHDDGYAWPAHADAEEVQTVCGPAPDCAGFSPAARGCAGYGVCESDSNGDVCGGPTRGVCTRVGHCHCRSGFAGNACNITYSTATGFDATAATCATTGPCQGRGRCHDTVRGPVCDCAQGYTGSPADRYDSLGWYASHIVAEGHYGAPVRNLTDALMQLHAARWTQQCLIWLHVNASLGWHNETNVTDAGLDTVTARQPVRPYRCLPGFGGTQCKRCEHCDPDHGTCVDRPAFRHSHATQHTGRCLCDPGWTHLTSSSVRCSVPRCPVHNATGSVCGMPRYGNCPVAADTPVDAPIDAPQACLCAHGYGGEACDIQLCPSDTLGQVCGHPDRDPHHRDLGAPALLNATLAASPDHTLDAVRDRYPSRGVCDAATRSCVCRPPYMGPACETLGCPRDPFTGEVCGPGGETACNRSTFRCACPVADATEAWDAVHERMVRPAFQATDRWGEACASTLGAVCRPLLANSSLPDTNATLCSGRGRACEALAPGGTPQCLCEIGYEGVYCERDRCHNRCGPNGTCVAYCRDTAGYVAPCHADRSAREYVNAQCECTVAGVAQPYLSERCSTEQDTRARAGCLDASEASFCNARAMCTVPEDSDSATCGPCERGFNGTLCQHTHTPQCALCGVAQSTYCDGSACQCRPTFHDGGAGSGCAFDACTATGGTHPVASDDPRYGFGCVCPPNATWYVSPINKTEAGCRWLCGATHGHECGDPSYDPGRCATQLGPTAANYTVLACACNCETTPHGNATCGPGRWATDPGATDAMDWLLVRDPQDDRPTCEPLCPLDVLGSGGTCNCVFNGTEGSSAILDYRCRAPCNGRHNPVSPSAYPCVCEPAWAWGGNNCTEDRCAPGGVYDEGASRCRCLEGFLHEHAGAIHCTTRCLHNGTWNASTQQCDCVPPFAGDRCEYGECAHNGEWCLECGCKCDPGQPGWGGPYCNTDQCIYGNASAHNGTCLCAPGAHGPLCQFQDCNGRGVYDNSTGRCVCTPGYSGTFCGRNRCFPAPPTPTGTGEDDFECDCGPFGYDNVSTPSQACTPSAPLIATPATGFEHALTPNAETQTLLWRSNGAPVDTATYAEGVVCETPAVAEHKEGYRRCTCGTSPVQLNTTTQNYACWDPCTVRSSNLPSDVTGRTEHAIGISVHTECACNATRPVPPFGSCAVYATTATSRVEEACRAWIPILWRCGQILNRSVRLVSQVDFYGFNGTLTPDESTYSFEEFQAAFDVPPPTLLRGVDWRVLEDCACDVDRWPTLPRESCPLFPCRRGRAPWMSALVTAVVVVVVFLATVVMCVDRAHRRDALPPSTKPDAPEIPTTQGQAAFDSSSEDEEDGESTRETAPLRRSTRLAHRYIHGKS